MRVDQYVGLTGDFANAFSLLGRGPLAGPELVPVRLATACTQVLGIAGAGISVFTGDGIRVPVGASDTDSANAERLQFTAAEGPCISAHQSGKPVMATESEIAHRWPAFYRGLIDETPFRGVSSMPLRNGLAEMATIDFFFHRSDDVAGIDLHQVDAILELVTDTLLDEMPLAPDSVPRWLDSPAAEERSWIFLAIGMINVDARLTTQDALEVLRALARTNSQSVDETARDLVNRSPTGHRFPI